MKFLAAKWAWNMHILLILCDISWKVLYFSTIQVFCLDTHMSMRPFSLRKTHQCHEKHEISSHISKKCIISAAISASIWILFTFSVGYKNIRICDTAYLHSDMFYCVISYNFENFRSYLTKKVVGIFCRIFSIWRDIRMFS